MDIIYHHIPILNRTIEVPRPNLYFIYCRKKLNCNSYKFSLQQFDPELYPKIQKICNILDEIYNTKNEEEFIKLRQKLIKYQPYVDNMYITKYVSQYLLDIYCSKTYELYEVIGMVYNRLGRYHEFSIYVHKLYIATKSRRDKCRCLKQYEDMLKYAYDFHKINEYLREVYDEYFRCYASKQKLFIDSQYTPNKEPSIPIIEANPHTNPIVYYRLRLH
jgi:hypothetical protein